MHAWNLLKAIPGQQGYMGTLPPSLVGLQDDPKALGMLGRRRAAAGEKGLGDVMHMRRTMPAQYEGEGDNRRMVSPTRQVDMPSEAGDMRPGETFMPDPLPATDRRVERDLSPLREMGETMISHTPRVTVGEMAGSGGTSMARVPGYELMPEESFFSPREQRLAREGMEQTIGRQLTGGQRGGRTNIRGGSGAGMNLPLRGEDDEGKRLRAGSRRRRATTLQNVEGVAQNARLGGASSEFVDQPQEQRRPTQQEKIADILSGMATAHGGTFEDQTAQEPTEPKERKERPMRQMSNRYRENLERVRQGEKPDLNVPMDEETMGMFQNPGSDDSQAARQRLMQFAGQQGRSDGSARQNQIDRAA